MQNSWQKLAYWIQQYAKKVVYHDQLELIQKSNVGLTSLIIVIYHIKRIMIIKIHTEKKFEKNQHLFMINVF